MTEAMKQRLQECLDRNLRREGKCLVWVGKLNKAGYGRIAYKDEGGKRVNTGTHRLAYELKNGPIPMGLLVRHKCDNRPCANVEHLELGTHADNARDATERGRRRVVFPSGWEKELRMSMLREIRKTREERKEWRLACHRKTRAAASKWLPIVVRLRCANAILKARHKNDRVLWAAKLAERMVDAWECGRQYGVKQWKAIHAGKPIPAPPVPGRHGRPRPGIVGGESGPFADADWDTTRRGVASMLKSFARDSGRKSASSLDAGGRPNPEDGAAADTASR